MYFNCTILQAGFFSISGKFGCLCLNTLFLILVKIEDDKKTAFQTFGGSVEIAYKIYGLL